MERKEVEQDQTGLAQGQTGLEPGLIGMDRNILDASDVRLNRREVLSKSGALAAVLGGVFISATAEAQGVHGFRNRVKKYQEYKKKNPEPSQSWLDSILPNSKKKTDPAATLHPALFQAANGSTEIGVRSKAYVQGAMAKGATQLTPCLKSIEAMIPVANALGKLAEIDAGRLKEMAKLSQAFVGDCERECLKNVATHPALQTCANSCAHLKREINTLLKA